jgi:integrase
LLAGIVGDPQQEANMASIQARTGIAEDGRQRTHYRVQVRLRGFPPVSASFERRTDAKEWAKATEAAMREGRHFPQREAKRHLLRDLVERQLDSVRTRRPHDYDRQEHLLGWWRDQLGDYALAHITPALIAKHRDALLNERSPATVNRYLAALSKAFSNAVKEWHWLYENPVQRVAKETEPQGRVRFLSDPERDALLSACRESALPVLHVIVLLALTTGMRRGELLGLRWPDIDLGRPLIVLNKTKNRERRSVPMVPEVAALLREHAKVRRLDSGLVFPGNGSRPVDIDRAWYVALEKAKIKNFRFHDLRHTAASYLAMSGATTAELAAVLGHKTLAMVKRYAHLSDQHTGAVLQRMTQKYFGHAVT